VISSSIQQFQVKDGVWQPPLVTFRFNLPSDPNGQCGTMYSREGQVVPQPCYFVTVGHGNISFGHVSTMYQDRFQQNQQGGGMATSN